MFADGRFTCPTLAFASVLDVAYVYHYTYVSETNPLGLGATHGAELAGLFGHVEGISVEIAPSVRGTRPSMAGKRFNASSAEALTDSMSEKSITSVAMSVTSCSTPTSVSASRIESALELSFSALRPRPDQDAVAARDHGRGNWGVRFIPLQQPRG